MRKKGLKGTRYPGVKVDPATGEFHIRAKVRDLRSGKIRQVERRVNAKSPLHASQLRALLIEQLRSPPVPSRTLEAYARSWLSGRRKSVKLSSLRQYASVLDHHILPAFGDRCVEDITSLDVREWRDAQSGSPRTINSRLSLLKAIFEDAVDELDLARNPAKRVQRLPCTTKYSENAPGLLSIEEVERLSQVLLARDNTASRALFAMLVTGMRIGEARALHWSSVDFGRGLIRIEKNLARTRITTPKSGRSRNVPIIPALEVALRQQERAQRQRWGACNVVFGTPSPISEHQIRAALRATLNEADIQTRITPHGLRRTFNNLLRHVTTGPLQREIVGHRSERMTDLYSVVQLEEKKQAVVSAFAAARFHVPKSFLTVGPVRESTPKGPTWRYRYAPRPKGARPVHPSNPQLGTLNLMKILSSSLALRKTVSWDTEGRLFGSTGGSGCQEDHGRF